MRHPCCFRQFVARAAPHNIIDGGLQADSMTDGNIDRFHVDPGTQDRADAFIFIQQGLPGPATVGYRLMGTDQTGLAHADGGEPGQHPQVTGNTKTARMCVTLTVA